MGRLPVIYCILQGNRRTSVIILSDKIAYNITKRLCFCIGVSDCRKSHFESLGQAFSKACVFLGQRPVEIGKTISTSRISAESKKPYLKRFFEGSGELFSRKKVPLNCSHYTDKSLEKGAGGTFFDTLTPMQKHRRFFTNSFCPSWLSLLFI